MNIHEARLEACHCGATVGVLPASEKDQLHGLGAAASRGTRWQSPSSRDDETCATSKDSKKPKVRAL